MTTRKAIKAVLNNFLGTFTSRYSEHDGYWLFGMLVDCLELPFRVNLLEPADTATAATPLITATHLAVVKFQEQVKKAGLCLSCMWKAELTITRSAGAREGEVNGNPRVGYDVLFRVRVASDQAKIYQSERLLFVAPHDPSAEYRSTGSLPQASGPNAS